MARESQAAKDRAELAARNARLETEIGKLTQQIGELSSRGGLSEDDRRLIRGMNDRLVALEKAKDEPVVDLPAASQRKPAKTSPASSPSLPAAAVPAAPSVTAPDPVKKPWFDAWDPHS